ncbi:RNAse III [Granulicella rosea]|uniref:Ribonuclease 3 n=1 Tax=Granulicella rosea TaxID=474952 RepID=A0A239K7H8_9BACT|nr:ribonuclease III [Granulicella rosea]SNT14317.1 RNAse III [Granulicella rosea]
MAGRKTQTGGSSFAGLEELVGHRFRRPELLELALTHRSASYEGGGGAGSTAEVVADPARDNEQLEFVGDAVLGMLVAEALYRRYPGSREGELTRLRASVVNRRHLGVVGGNIELGRWLRLGHGEEASGGRNKPALLANAVEALIAAIYLDGGIEVARAFVETQVLSPALPQLEQAMAEGDTFSGAVGDHKSALQEHLQAAGMGQPKYALTGQTGPDHRRLFQVEVRVDGTDGPPLAVAQGSSKKVAQQEAARLAIAVLTARNENAGAMA